MAMNTDIRHVDAGSVRAVLDGGTRKLEVLAAPFGSSSRRDRLNQWLSARTDFMISLGDRRPLLYMHGRTPLNQDMHKPTTMGVATVSRIDDQGLWMTTELDNSELSTRTWEAAKAGRARASTGSVGYLTRPDRNVPGEVTVWPIAELSLWDISNGMNPVSDDAIVLPLRAMFDELSIEFPNQFQAGEATDEGGVANQPATLDLKQKEETDMPTEIELAVATVLKSQADAEASKAAMRATIIDELKKEPAYRGVFATKKETVKADGKPVPADEQETHEFVHALRMAGLSKNPGAFRVLEESEALEGGPMVPDDLLNKIWEKRGVYSVVRQSGMQTLTTSKLVLNIPVETDPIAIAETIAEEGAYIANEPAFTTTPVTMLKKGLMVTVTEEMLEDQDLFQSYLVRAAGKSIGLAENKVLFDAINTIDGVEIGSAGAPTVAEFDAKYFSLAQQYRQEAVWITNDATLGYIRGLLVATPRAYGSYPDLTPGEVESFQGKRVFANSNWPTLAAAGDDALFCSFINLSEAIAWVDRKGMSIFVDPYGDAANGRVRFFPSARFAAAVVNSDAMVGMDDTA